MDEPFFIAMELRRAQQMANDLMLTLQLTSLVFFLAVVLWIMTPNHRRGVDVQTV